MPRDTNNGYEVYFEDFFGDLIPDELATSNDSGTITVNVGLTGNKAVGSSILRLDNSNDGDNEMCEVDTGHTSYRVSDGHLYFEARVSPHDVSVMAVNVGFHDETTESGNSLPVELSGTTWTSNAGDWIGFVFDADATTNNWHAFWVDDSNDTSVAIGTLQSDVALADTTWYTLRLDLYDAGSGNQVVAEWKVQDANGNHWEYRNSSTIDRDAALSFHIGNELRGAVDNGSLDVDYIEVGKSRVA
jgi:hypothetical protein